MRMTRLLLLVALLPPLVGCAAARPVGDAAVTSAKAVGKGTVWVTRKAGQGVVYVSKAGAKAVQSIGHNNDPAAASETQVAIGNTPVKGTDHATQADTAAGSIALAQAPSHGQANPETDTETIVQIGSSAAGAQPTVSARGDDAVIIADAPADGQIHYDLPQLDIEAQLASARTSSSKNSKSTTR